MSEWDRLSDEQRSGMTRDYFESLPEQNRRAFAERTCIKGDGKPRAYGSPFCSDHLRELQEAWRADIVREPPESK